METFLFAPITEGFAPISTSVTKVVAKKWQK